MNHSSHVLHLEMQICTESEQYYLHVEYFKEKNSKNSYKMTSQIQEVKYWQITYTNKYKLHIFTLTMMGSCPIDMFIVLTIFFSIMNVRVIMKGAL